MGTAGTGSALLFSLDQVADKCLLLSFWSGFVKKSRIMISAGNPPQLCPLAPLNRLFILYSQQGHGNFVACCFPSQNILLLVTMVTVLIALASKGIGICAVVAQIELVLVVTGLLCLVRMTCVTGLSGSEEGLTQDVLPSPWPHQQGALA